MGVNKVILLGNLGKDPELRYTNNQKPVCSFSLATTERRMDSTGKWNDHTEWHNIVTFGKTAENCAQYLKKGRQAFIEGRIQTRKWQDKEGRDRYTTEVLAASVQFIGGGRGAESGSSSSRESVSAGGSGTNGASHEVLATLPSADEISGADSVSFDDDDIPF